MRLSVRASCFTILAVLAVAAPGRAENPRVKLVVRNADAEEALAQLSRAADVPVQLYTTLVPANQRGPLPPGLDQKLSFDWNDISFARALRQICEKYNLRPGRRPGGYVLYPSFGAAAAPAAALPVGLAERNGIRLYARSASIYENRLVNFQDLGQNGGGGASMQIQILAELGNRDADTIAGIQNVVAKDDLGNLIGQQGTSYSGGYSDGTYPDEWGTSLGLPAPHPKATKLVWLEGDLMAYRKVRAFRIEIPLPPVEKVVRKQVGDMAFVLSRYQDSLKPTDDDDLPLPNAGATPGIGLRTRVYSPAGSGTQSRYGWGMQPYVVGVSGRTYTANQTSGGTSSDGQTLVTYNSLLFPDLKEPPAKLVWDLIERSEPVKLFSFRMANIPLPAPLAFNAKAAAPPPAAIGPLEDRPFFEKGGGTLVNRVVIRDKPAGNGVLDLGMATRAGAGWGPLRWTQVEVTDGVARVEDLKPGVYRLVRRFRPKAGDSPTGDGRWQSEELEVTAIAGKEVAPPALQWGSAPAAKPAPMRKPGTGRRASK